MQRVTQLIRLKPEYRDVYEEYHRNIWPELIKNLRNCHIQNYSISYVDGLLFSYYEYTGDQYEEDMARLASYPVNRKWRSLMKKMQISYRNDSTETGWERMDEVFYLE